MAYLHGGKHTLYKIIGIINDKYWLLSPRALQMSPQTNNTSTSGMNEE